MATKKEANSRKGKAEKKTTKSSKRAPPKKEPRKKPKREPKKEPKEETGIVVRRNASVMRTRDTRASNRPTPVESERTPMGERIQSMGGAHFASSVSAGLVGSALAVTAVGQGWVGPKSSAGILMGAGTLGMALGWWLESDHLMTAGAGLAAAGTYSIANQFSVDAYEAIEARAERKREEREAKEEEEKSQKRLADARALIEEDKRKGKQRNAQRIVILSADGRPIADVADPNP